MKSVLYKKISLQTQFSQKNFLKKKEEKHKKTVKESKIFRKIILRMKNSWNFSSNPRIRIFVKICKNLFKKAEKNK